LLCALSSSPSFLRPFLRSFFRCRRLFVPSFGRCRRHRSFVRSVFVRCRRLFGRSVVRSFGRSVVVVVVVVVTVPSFVQSCVRSLARSLSSSLVRWFVGSLVRWFVGSLVRWFVGSLVRWFVAAWRRRCAVMAIAAIALLRTLQSWSWLWFDSVTSLKLVRRCLLPRRYMLFATTSGHSITLFSSERQSCQAEGRPRDIFVCFFIICVS